MKILPWRVCEWSLMWTMSPNLHPPSLSSHSSCCCAVAQPHTHRNSKLKQQEMQLLSVWARHSSWVWAISQQFYRVNRSQVIIMTPLCLHVEQKAVVVVSYGHFILLIIQSRFKLNPGAVATSVCVEYCHLASRVNRNQVPHMFWLLLRHHVDRLLSGAQVCEPGEHFCTQLFMFSWQVTDWEKGGKQGKWPW